MFFGVFGALYWLMQYLQQVLGYTPIEAGIRTLPWTAMPMLVAALAGVATGKIGPRHLLASGLLLEALALGWSALIMDSHVPYLEILPALLLGGIGMGLIFAPLTETVIASVRMADRGTASGANATFRERGFAFGVAALTTVVTRQGASLAQAQSFVAAVRPAIWGSSAVLLISLPLVFAIPARGSQRCRPAPLARLDAEVVS